MNVIIDFNEFDHNGCANPRVYERNMNITLWQHRCHLTCNLSYVRISKHAGHAWVLTMKKSKAAENVTALSEENTKVAVNQYLRHVI